SGSKLEVKNSNFTDSFAAIDGGDIYLEDNVQLNISNCNITGSMALGGHGGVIATNNNNIVHITNSSVYRSKAKEGGVISTDSGNVIELSNSSFVKNKALNGNGGVISSNGTTTVTIHNSTLNNNRANGNGGVISGATIVLENAVLTNNSAFNGGAIYGDTNGLVNVSNSHFTGNNVSGIGSSIYASGALNVTDSTFASENVTGNATIFIKSNKKNIALANNNMTGDLLDIYNDGGLFVTPTDLVFGNATVDVFEKANLTALLTDDNGNIIGSSTPVNGEVNGTNVTFVFNDTTKLFDGSYTPETKGNYTISGNYTLANDCNVTDGILTVNTLPIKIDSVIDGAVYGNFSGNVTVMPVTVMPVNATGNITIKVNGTKYNPIELSNNTGDWLIVNLTMIPGVYNVT
ncbi:MAG: hypothetical protein HUK13_10345, partial [Muribaculaceae bacterium]|nr:hypothetical protein [Muribaculaceae bacterium]